MQDDRQNKLARRLVEKSIEAFLLGLEVYNKPTIKYRIEGFSYFICNAWELMLKAELLNRSILIYYTDAKDRTISLTDTIKKIYSDKNTRIRLNLERIIDLRNISTHFITTDYEVKYAPLFQACVLNYIKELQRFHKEDITCHVAQNFLTISASYEPLTNEEIRIKYSPEIAEKFIEQANEIDVLTQEYNSDSFAINIKQHLYITREKESADFTIKISKDGSTNAAIIKDYKDPSDTHKYSYENVIKAVQERMKKKNIVLNYKSGFNTYVLGLIIKFYNIKLEPKYAYKHIIGNNEHFTYSQQFVEFIVDRIAENPDGLVESLKNE